MSTTGVAGVGVGPAAAAPTSPAGPWWRRRDPLVAAGATVLLAVLSLVGLGTKQLWVDEGVAVGLADVPFSRFVVVVTGWEVNQAPYYLLFRLWSVLGDDPATMRLLSAGLAVATVPVTYRLGRRLYGSRAASWAAVLLAVNGLVLQWAQQIRGYTLALLLVTVATLLFVRLVDRPTWGRALLYAVVAGAAVASHFFSGLVVVAHLLSVLVLRPRPTRVLVASGGLLAVLVAPFVLFVATAQGDPLGWVEDATPVEVARLFVRLSGGWLPFLAYATVGVLGLWATWRAVRPAPRSVEAWHHLLPVFWAGFPVAAAVAFSLAVQPVVVGRFFIIIVPALTLLLGLGVASTTSLPWRSLVAVVLVGASLVGCLNWYRTPEREDWRSVMARVVPELRPGDGMVVAPRTGNATATYYARELGRDDLPLLLPDTAGPPDRDRYWLLRRGDTVRGWLATQQIPEWLDRHYVVVRQEEYQGLDVLLYQRRP